MIKEKEYQELKARLDNPQSAELRQKMSPNPNGHDLCFHLKRIDEYVYCDITTSDTTKELLELDYSISLREAKKIMDNQGWK